MLKARGLTWQQALKNVSLEVRAGEILGIYGFMGCGVLELTRALFGKIKPAGVLALDGEALQARDDRHGAARRPRLRAGEPPLDAFPPRADLQERDDQHPRAHLVALAEAAAPSARSPARHVDSLHIKTAGVDALLGHLSGGNQQKVALAKWLTHAPKVLILSEPTRGMDVGAKEDVMKIVRNLRDQGMAIIVVSTEPETILSLADRILVMKKGEIVKEFSEGTVSKDRLLEAA